MDIKYIDVQGQNGVVLLAGIRKPAGRDFSRRKQFDVFQSNFDGEIDEKKWGNIGGSYCFYWSINDWNFEVGILKFKGWLSGWLPCSAPIWDCCVGDNTTVPKYFWGVSTVMLFQKYCKAISNRYLKIRKRKEGRRGR